MYRPQESVPNRQHRRTLEQVLRAVPGTSSAYAERNIGGYYLEITPDRLALARYRIMIQDVQDTIATALGGQTVTTTVEGRQRFTVNMRYPRDLRDNPKKIASDILVPMPAGGAVPLGEIATVALTRGPTSVRTENGSLPAISTSTSTTVISAATSPMRSVRCKPASSSHQVTTWSGASNMNIWNAPRPG